MVRTALRFLSERGGADNGYQRTNYKESA